jgi:HEAT repeat protein
MKILFCDLCNESVPQADLDQGRAFLRKGRVVCAVCDRSMSAPGAAGPFGGGAGAEEGGAGTATLAPPAAATLAPPAVHPAAHTGREHARVEHAPRTGGTGVWLAIVTLVFSAAAFALLVDRLTTLEGAMQRGDRNLSGDLALAEMRLDQALAGLDDRERALTDRLQASVAEGRAGAEDVGRELSKELAAAQSETAHLAQTLAGLQAELTRARDDARAHHDELAGRLNRAEEDLHYYSQRLSDLEMAALRPVAVQPDASEPKGGAPAWQGLLADLASPLAGTRLQAVDALGETKDPAVVPHLLPILKDPDIFVRMSVARVLGDLGSLDAVPALIDALEDPEAAVREASIVALKQMTGRDFRFDPLGPEAERAKRVKAWRDWWEKEGAGGA